MKIPLLARIVTAIVLGVVCGLFFPEWLSRVFATINGIFSNFLGFIVPLLILGLVAPGIADVGRRAGKLLLITVLIAYGFTLISGFLSYGVCELLYPVLLGGEMLNSVEEGASVVTPYFMIDMPPLFGVMSALIAAFLLGVGMTVVQGSAIKRGMEEFRDIIVLAIEKAIIPFLPLYIFGIFLSMTQSGQVGAIFALFVKVVLLTFSLTLVVLLFQFGIAGMLAHKNPLHLLRRMGVAYVTALGTQSSAATIPVTLEQTKKNGVRDEIADFVVPLCATIHLSGSTLKIVACAIAIMMLGDIHYTPLTMIGFICMLGITMVAAPGVPGGAIMAALAILESILGMNESELGLMIALYIAMDSFGTATNVTGDGAVAIIIDAIDHRKKNKDSDAPISIHEINTSRK